MSSHRPHILSDNNRSIHNGKDDYVGSRAALGLDASWVTDADVADVASWVEVYVESNAFTLWVLDGFSEFGGIDIHAYEQIEAKYPGFTAAVAREWDGSRPLMLLITIELGRDVQRLIPEHKKTAVLAGAFADDRHQRMLEFIRLPRQERNVSCEMQSFHDWKLLAFSHALPYGSHTGGYNHVR